MDPSRIEAIGNRDNASIRYSGEIKQRKPWDFIGAEMTGIGSLNLPDKFNSAFTVGKGGDDSIGAFRG